MISLLSALVVGSVIETSHVHVPVAPAESLHVAVTGTGSPVVIVPGIWSNAYAFRKVIPELAARSMQVIVIEPLGVASSSRPRHADYSMTAQARRIASVLDSLGVKRAVFVGQALAASIVMRMTVEFPDRVNGLVLLEGGAAEVSATPGLKTGLAVAAVLFKIFPSNSLLRRRLRSDFRNVSGDKSWITDDVIQNYMKAWNKNLSATFRAYRAIANSAEPRPLGPRLGEIEVPVHLLMGAAPHYGGVEPSELKPMEQSIPLLQVTRISGAGHLLHEERPDVVVSAVADLVNSRRR